jgi:hypothetical protein
MSLNAQQFGAQQYDNVDATGNWTWTVKNGDYACGNAVQPFDLSSAGMTAGRWVILRVLKSTGSITGYVGATVTPPSGLTVYSISREDVSYSGIAYDCIVVTLV